MTIEQENSKYLLRQTLNKLPLSPADRVGVLTEILGELVLDNYAVSFTTVLNQLRQTWGLDTPATQPFHEHIDQFMAGLPSEPNAAAYRVTSALAGFLGYVRHQHAGTVVASRVRETLEQVTPYLTEPPPAPVGYPELLSGFLQLLDAVPSSQLKEVLLKFHTSFTATVMKHVERKDILPLLKSTLRSLGVAVVTPEDLQKIHEEECEECRNAGGDHTHH